MTRRATVLAGDVEWVSSTLTQSLDELQKQPDYNAWIQKASGELVPVKAHLASFTANRRQLIEDINEFLTERMRHG